MVTDVESALEFVDEIDGVSLEPCDGRLATFGKPVLLCKEHQEPKSWPGNWRRWARHLRQWVISGNLQRERFMVGSQRTQYV